MPARSIWLGTSVLLLILRIGKLPFTNQWSLDVLMCGCRGWISAGPWAGINVDDFPQLKQWEERMWARPATKKGADVPDKYTMKELLQDKEAMEKHAEKVS